VSWATPLGAVPLTVIGGSAVAAGTGEVVVQVADGTSHDQPVPLAVVTANGSGMSTSTRPELVAVPLLRAVTVKDPLVPATRGDLTEAVVTEKSTGTAIVTGVVIDAELSVVLPSDALLTEADTLTCDE